MGGEDRKRPDQPAQGCEQGIVDKLNGKVRGRNAFRDQPSGYNSSAPLRDRFRAPGIYPFSFISTLTLTLRFQLIRVRDDNSSSPPGQDSDRDARAARLSWMRTNHRPSADHLLPKKAENVDGAAENQENDKKSKYNRRRR